MVGGRDALGAYDLLLLGSLPGETRGSEASSELRTIHPDDPLLHFSSHHDFGAVLLRHRRKKRNRRQCIHRKGARKDACRWTSEDIKSLSRIFFIFIC